MRDISKQTEAVRAQFGPIASEYVTSSVHAGGPDLALLVEWSEGAAEKTALDIATGGGHTALALSHVYGHVIAADITDAMLKQAESFIRNSGRHNVEFALADAQSLPWDDASMDAVSCRIAAHHFLKPMVFLIEVVRVLKPRGVCLFEDLIAPPDLLYAERMNAIERLRDPSHARSLTHTEWTESFSNAGLHVENEREFRTRHDLAEWLARARTPDDRRREIVDLLLLGGSDAEAIWRTEFDSRGLPVAFDDRKLVLKALRT